MDDLRAFYDEHFGPLYALCYHRLGRDHHAAEEVVQETLLLAIEKMKDYDPARGDRHTWLAVLSRNFIRRALSQRRRFVAVGDVAAVATTPADERKTPERLVLVGVALARLPEKYRTVLERKYVEGESVREIATASATTEKTIESLLVRARAAFRAAFDAVTRPKHPTPPPASRGEGATTPRLTTLRAEPC